MKDIIRSWSLNIFLKKARIVKEILAFLDKYLVVHLFFFFTLNEN